MKWKFDEKVAAEFQTIAQQQIPNYDIVIDKCVQLARAHFKDNRQARIIDIGSARGRTLVKLNEAGFSDIYGVESSADMVAVSAFPDRITCSDRFPLPQGPFDMILANWTLHFIKEREAYLKDIFAGLKTGGLFVMSDRITGSELSYQCYLDFKRKNGVSEEAIRAKEVALEGVLVTRPLTWYLTTLEAIGFKRVEVIDASWCFNTLLCQK